MKSIFSKIKYLALGTAAVLVFVMTAEQANAQYSYVPNQYGYGIPSAASYYPSQNYYNDYYQNNNYYNQSYYANLNISCIPNVNYAQVGSTVTWSANVTGGNGYYTYSWSGSEGIAGYNQNVAFSYSTPGTKYASVTVTSGNRTVTQSCSNSVIVSGSYYNQYPQYQTPVYYQQPSYVSNYNGLDIGCYAEPANARIGQPVTWSAEVVGGIAPFTYKWTGTEGLSGNQASVIKYYNNSGAKYAIVTVTSADGKSASRSCTNNVTVAAAYKAPAKSSNSVTNTNTTVQTTTTQATTTASNSLAASAWLTLANVPWGWVSILIILLLFATVIYLIFNRSKI